MLFYVRQKMQDLTAQLAVSVQGYLSLDVIRRNNLELIRGVDRATTTTISALRTAVIVAQALGDQKLVLDQITTLNTTTSNLIESTSAMLRQQSAAINEGAAASTIDLEKLQAAFDNIYATMDEIDAFKLKALDTMSQTVATLTTQIDKAQSQLERAKPAPQPQPQPATGAKRATRSRSSRSRREARRSGAAGGAAERRRGRARADSLGRRARLTTRERARGSGGTRLDLPRQRAKRATASGRRE